MCVSLDKVQNVVTRAQSASSAEVEDPTAPSEGHVDVMPFLIFLKKKKTMSSCMLLSS